MTKSKRAQQGQEGGRRLGAGGGARGTAGRRGHVRGLARRQNADEVVVQQLVRLVGCVITAYVCIRKIKPRLLKKKKKKKKKRHAHFKQVGCVFSEAKQ